MAFETRSATISDDRKHEFTRNIDNLDYILSPLGSNLFEMREDVLQEGR